MSNNSPLVSIVTPAHNCAETLQCTLDSILGQSFENWEHIIVDDASTDSTSQILQSHCSLHARARWIGLNTNQGAAVARNTAIQAASGRYIAFLDSDDVWKPNKLAQQLDFMRRNEVLFCYSSYEKINENGDVIGKVNVPARQSYSDLLKNNKIGCLTAIYDSEKLGKTLMPLIRKRQDLGLWLKLLKVTPYAYGIDECLAQYRVRSNSISSKKSNAAKYTWQLYREIEKLPFLKASYYFACYAINGFAKTYIAQIRRRA